MKKIAFSKRTVIIVLFSILILATITFYLWSKGYFHILTIQKSPNKDFTTTVYSQDVTNVFPKNSGFTIKDSGNFNRTTLYQNATFQNMWWSPDSSAKVLSMKMDDKPYMVLENYNNYSTLQLSTIINLTIRNYKEFSNVKSDKSNTPLIQYDFIKWNNDSVSMNFEFSYKGMDNVNYNGTFLYNYKNGTLSNITCAKLQK